MLQEPHVKDRAAELSKTWFLLVKLYARNTRNIFRVFQADFVHAHFFIFDSFMRRNGYFRSTHSSNRNKDLENAVETQISI